MPIFLVIIGYCPPSHRLRIYQSNTGAIKTLPSFRSLTDQSLSTHKVAIDFLSLTALFSVLHLDQPSLGELTTRTGVIV